MARRSLVPAALVILTAAPVWAQDFGASYGVSLGADLTNHAMMSSAIPRAGGGSSRPQPSGPVMGAEAERGLRERGLWGGGRPAVAPPPMFATRPAVATTYRRDPAVTERVKTQYLQFVAHQAPAEVGMVRANLQRLDPVRAWSEMVAENGLHPGDVADAYAAYYIMNWCLATGQDAGRAQSIAVREQMRPVIAHNPRFVRLTEAQRQEMAEVLMVNYIFQRDTFMSLTRKHDPRARQLAAAAAARFTREIGIDPHTLLLTDRGFVRRT